MNEEFVTESEITKAEVVEMEKKENIIKKAGNILLNNWKKVVGTAVVAGVAGTLGYKVGYNKAINGIMDTLSDNIDDVVDTVEDVIVEKF